MSLENKEIYIPPEGPPEGIVPNPQIYLKMGEDHIYKMMEDFYIELGNSSIRGMFPGDLLEASRRSAAFFVFIMGGPPLYQKLYGPPMMRKRHLPFKIDEQARQVWLACFKKTLIDADLKYQFPIEHFDDFWRFLDKFSAWMVNSKTDN